VSSIIFAHALVFNITKKGEVYTPGGIDNEYLSRFEDSSFDKIYLLSRSKLIEKKPLESYFKLNNIENHFLKKYQGGYKFLFSIFFYLDLYKLSKNNSLIVINYPSSTGIFIMLFSYIFRLPFAVEVASDSSQYRTKKMGRLVDLIADFIGRLCIKRAVGALYVADFLKTKWPCSNNLVLSNVVLDELGVSKKLTSTKKKIIITTIGAVSYRKGVDILFDSLDKLDAKYNVEVHVAGPIIDNEILKMVKDINSKNKNIVLHGILSRSKVIDLLDKSDIYVQASRSEGLPRAVIEAMGRGLPVIASNLPGLKGVVREEFTFTIGDSAKLAELATQIINNGALYHKLSEGSIDTAKSYLSSLTKEKRKIFYNNCEEIMSNCYHL
jgi:glycosyltransferase involved in cell wall biosynthesis